ncbi:MAG: glucokinase [Alphaproteobacteria bacterium]|nr:glucokinase [Alphaproteobacteria bacterium]
MMMNALLVGDVGGTNVRFAMARRSNGRFVIDHFEKLEGDDFGSFEDALASYLATTGLKPDRACFALAGPVRDGEVLLTNRRWRVSARHVSDRFGIGAVNLLNDFAAMARAVPEYDSATFETIVDGTPVEGAPVLVAGPGTGFGVATLLGSDASTWHVLTGEGGHVAFSPRDKTELELARILLARYGYVSNELVASGSGLNAVHEAFCEIYGRTYQEISPQEMRRLADAGDAMFLSLIQLRANTVMSAVGDLVLANGALGGVVLAGGVTDRIADFLKTPEAYERFVERGPLCQYLRNCPVSLMRDPEAPLIGAAAFHEQETK